MLLVKSVVTSYLKPVFHRYFPFRNLSLWFSTVYYSSNISTKQLKCFYLTILFIDKFVQKPFYKILFYLRYVFKNYHWKLNYSKKCRSKKIWISFSKAISLDTWTFEHERCIVKIMQIFNWKIDRDFVQKLFVESGDNIGLIS